MGIDFELTNKTCEKGRKTFRQACPWCAAPHLPRVKRARQARPSAVLCRDCARTFSPCASSHHQLDGSGLDEEFA